MAVKINNKTNKMPVMKLVEPAFKDPSCHFCGAVGVVDLYLGSRSTWLDHAGQEDGNSVVRIHSMCEPCRVQLRGVLTSNDVEKFGE